MKVHNLKLFHLYKAYSDSISIEEIFIHLKKENNCFSGISDEEYFNNNIDAI